MKKLILIITLCVFSFAFLSADVYIKTNTHTDAFEMMGKKQPAKDDTTEQWIGDNKFSMVTKNMTTVVDLGKKMVYLINHASKTVVKTQLPLDMSKLLPAQMQQMVKMMKPTVKVTPNGQTKKIGKWDCKGYDVVFELKGMMQMTMKMVNWTTTDVPFDWKKYRDEMMPEFIKASMAQMNLTDDMLNEFQKIEGFQVGTDMSMEVMGSKMKTNSRVVEITKKDAPAGTYDVPAGYTEKEGLSMMDLQKK